MQDELFVYPHNVRTEFLIKIFGDRSKEGLIDRFWTKLNNVSFLRVHCALYCFKLTWGNGDFFIGKTKVLFL